MTQPLRDDRRYTYADFLTWDDDVQYELIDGVAYAMAPPSISHQRVSGNLHYQLYDFLKDKPCEVFSAPVGVRLNANDTVLQPDIVVVCDQSKIGDKAVNGTPDMIIEVLSPSTARRDRIVKFHQYLKAGVREYWTVDIDDRTVYAHILRDGDYITRIYTEADTVPVHVLDGCHIALSDVFADVGIPEE